MKRFLSFFFFVFSLSQISAQLFTHYGGSAGFGSSKLLGEFNEFEKSRDVQCFSIGLVGEHHFDAPFLLTSEINFMSYGDSLLYEHSVFSNSDTVTVSKNYKNTRYYLQIPITAGLNIPVGNDTRIFFKGGVYYASLIGSRTRGHETLINGTLVSDTVIDSNSFFPYSKKEFGILAGLGYGSDSYAVEFRLSRGLSELFNQAGALPKYNGAILLTLSGYLPN
jgi:hypothetical protein